VSAGHRDAGRASTWPPAAVGRPGLRVCRDAAGATYDLVPCGAAESCGPLRFLCQRIACSLVRRALPVQLPGHTPEWPSTVNGQPGATCGAGSTVAVDRGPQFRQATRRAQRHARRGLLSPERDRQKRRPFDSHQARRRSGAAACFGGVLRGRATCNTVENVLGGNVKAAL